MKIIFNKIYSMSKNKRETSANNESIYEAIKNIFRLNPLSKFTVKRINEHFGEKVFGELRDEILAAVDRLEQEDFIFTASRGRYALTEANKNGIRAKVVTISPRLVFVKTDTIEEDIVVEPKNSPNIIVDDIVEIFILPKRRRGRIEAIIDKVVERKHTTFVGTVELNENGSYAFVSTESRYMPNDIYVSASNLLSAKNNDKVLVSLDEWAEGSKNPTGHVVTVFGEAGDNNTEMHAILAEYGLPYHFDDAIEQAADKIPDKITNAETKNRRDFRTVTTFTIDPKDAKDFDDALSIRKTEDGFWEIGVHIADVTHYVTEHSILDNEAEERATSVYLVDRVVPMLPEKLSNGLCSLRPNEEKLCFSAVFKMNDNAEVLEEWFGRTVINSDRRFTYEDAQSIIETEVGDFAAEVLNLDRLAKILRKERYKNGSIAFERDEVKFDIDENGKPLGVYFKEMKDSNHLIEEFMLLANRKVAEFIGRKRPEAKTARTFVYRIHDRPNEEKYEKFSKFAAKFGYILKAKTDRAIAKEMNKLLNGIKGKKEENLFSVLALRSMAKARYSTDNIGHYGLAFDYYTHFTSPIRRYPDMMVHRLLQRYLDGGSSADKDYYEGLCNHSSEREIRAAEAERASNKYKMVEYMSDKIGMEFDGYISGITEWGIYVELNETKIEGMVSLRDIADDTYNFDSENYRLVGVSSSRIITLGDPVRISVIRADLKRKLLDYNLVSHTCLNTAQTHVFSKNKPEQKRNTHWEDKKRGVQNSNRKRRK